MAVIHSGIPESNGATISYICLQCKKIHILLFYLYKTKQAAYAFIEISMYLCESIALMYDGMSLCNMQSQKR